MAEHTPGPWKVSEDGDYVYPAATKGQEVFRSNWICQLFYAVGGGMMENAGANARLIAAAPELLEALRLSVIALKRLDQFKPYPGCANPFAEVIAIDNAAIAKAIGQEQGQ